MSRRLSRVISDVLTHYGAIVEESGDECLEFLSSEILSDKIKLPEYGRLRFSYNSSCEDAIQATYDSDLFRSLEDLFAGTFKIAAAHYPPYIPKIEKIKRTVSEKLSLANATFRMDRTETGIVNYLLISFRYTALSDEKREGLISMLLNEQSLSMVQMSDNMDEIVKSLTEPELKPIKIEKDSMKAIQAAFCAASSMIKVELQEFIKSLERRLHRDIKRVNDYYEELKGEAIKAIEQLGFQMSMDAFISSERKKALKYKDTDWKTKDMRDIKNMERQYLEKRAEIKKMVEDKKWQWKGDEKIDKLIDKFHAMESEKRWKVQDLKSKYSLNIRIKALSAIRIETRTPVMWINIKRRLSARQYPMAFNPITRHPDPLPCESCFSPRGGYYICDDKLHILCGECFKKCSQCGRQYCTACHKVACPRCKKQI